jgi:hypothetical protein
MCLSSGASISGLAIELNPISIPRGNVARNASSEIAHSLPAYIPPPGTSDKLANSGAALETSPAIRLHRRVERKEVLADLVNEYRVAA